MPGNSGTRTEREEPEWVIRQGFACVWVPAPSPEAAIEIAAKRLLGSHWRRLLRCHAPALWVGAWSAGALWVATALAGRAMLPAAATLAIGLATWSAAAAAAVYAAPAFARLRSVPWLLDGLPFAELGTTGRLLRFMLQRLDPAPASRSP